GRARTYVMADVGDVDLQRPMPVSQRLNPHGVVEITRRFAVDGHDIQFAKVAAAGEFVRGNRPGNGAGLFQNIIRKAMRNMVRPDEDLDVDAEIAGQPQNLDDPADWTIAIFTEIHDFRGDDHAFEIVDAVHNDRGCAHAIDGDLSRGKSHVFRNLDPLAEPLVVRNHEISLTANA